MIQRHFITLILGSSFTHLPPDHTSQCHLFGFPMGEILIKGFQKNGIGKPKYCKILINFTVNLVSSTVQ